MENQTNLTKLYNHNKNPNQIKSSNLNIYLLNSRNNNSHLEPNKIKYVKTIQNTSSFFKNNELVKKSSKFSQTAKNYYTPNHRIEKLSYKNDNKENKIKSLSEILNKLVKLRHELDEISTIEKKKINLIRLSKPTKYFSKLKEITKNHKRNKYLSYIDDYNKNKLLLKNIKLHNFGIRDKVFYNHIYSEGNRNKKYKTLCNFYNSKKTKKNIYDNLGELSIIKKYKKSNKKNIKNKTLFLDHRYNIKNIKKNSSVEKVHNFTDEQNKNNSKRDLIINRHFKYIEKIRQNELIDLIDRFKKSLNKNKEEEAVHYQSLVFPLKLINSLITMKNDLTINKYRNEYLNKLKKYQTTSIINGMKLRNNYIINNINSLS